MVVFDKKKVQPKKDTIEKNVKNTITVKLEEKKAIDENKQFLIKITC